MSIMTLREICEELVFVDDRLIKLESQRPADIESNAYDAWDTAYSPVRQRMFRLVRLLGNARRQHVGAQREQYRPIVDQVLAEVRR